MRRSTATAMTLIGALGVALPTSSRRYGKPARTFSVGSADRERVEAAEAKQARKAKARLLQAERAVLGRVRRAVHGVGWAAQGDLQLVCDSSWAQAKWGEEPAAHTVVFEAEDGRFYTFDEESVTCAGCRAGSRMALR